MTTFYVTENYSIDDKGRLVIPASLRKVTGRKQPLKNFVLVFGLGGCLWLFSEDGWTKFEERLYQLSVGTRKQRDFARAFLLGASKVTVDKQGRISIPSSLLNRAGLGREAVLHGQVGRLEIWSPERFKQNTEPTVSNLDELYEESLGNP
ncbi:MAG: division/cell wall cluster transcriptional repressor MraZ [Candidatus Eisenbacteria bacterium]|nr:division/cell wall cluster transcriptional repressor MraZ [Candidatus Eisenbacteria bacterium]